MSCRPVCSGNYEDVRCLSKRGAGPLRSIYSLPRRFGPTARPGAVTSVAARHLHGASPPRHASPPRRAVTLVTVQTQESSANSNCGTKMNSWSYQVGSGKPRATTSPTRDSPVIPSVFQKSLFPYRRVVPWLVLVIHGSSRYALVRRQRRNTLGNSPYQPIVRCSRETPARSAVSPSICSVPQEALVFQRVLMRAVWRGRGRSLL